MQNSFLVSAEDTENLTVIAKQTVLNNDFTVYGSIENPLFQAKDVAEWIEINNVSQMLEKIDEDEKGIYITYTPGGNQKKWFVTEDGLYEILMLSRKPIAKEFKKEVKKILHQIRLNGGYSVPKTFAEALLLAGEQQKKIEAMQPKAEFYDKVTGSTDTCDMKEAAKILNFKNIGRNRLFEILRDKNILDSTNKPYQTYVDRGYFRIIESKWEDSDGDIHINLKTVVFQKGLDFIRRLILKDETLINETSDRWIESEVTE